MSADNNLFDKIRIAPTKARARKKMAAEEKPAKDTLCSDPECSEIATHKAPKGRGRDNEFLWFCVTHVREYNKTYNYFQGMDDGDIAKYQKDASFGHRPTWKMGVNGKDGPNKAKSHDPYAFMAHRARQKAQKSEQESPNQRGRKLLNVEKKSLETLELDGTATKDDIKKRFKELAKKHHPDVNGGDKGSEERLREIIQAYNYLKAAGFC